MQRLEELLKENDYIKSNFKLSKTQHLLITAKINGISGKFILDTGASNSCVDFQFEEYFKLKTQDSKTQVAGAGAVGMPSKISEYNMLKIGRWKAFQMNVVLFDLTHVNQALSQVKIKPIHGIIGADVLLEGKAIIDYENKSLFLKKQDTLKRNLLLF
ncbi:MAG: retropepsin-like aspartic protease [Flavobacteriaceae bacterium]